MKRIILLAFIAIAAVSCEETIVAEKEHYEFGETGGTVELELKDGKYVPASKPVSQEAFDALFKDSWRLNEICHVSSTGKITKRLTAAEPTFSIKEGGIIRQYDGKGSYVDGTYSYDPTDGTITFTDVLDCHPEFRLITLKDNEMTGAFIGPDNTSDLSVLTIYLYKKISSADPEIIL